MPYVPELSVDATDLLGSAESRWTAVLAARPDLGPAVDLQRRLIATVVEIARAAAHAVRRALRGARARARRLAAWLLCGLRIVAGARRSGRGASRAPLLVLRLELGAPVVRVHLLHRGRRGIRHSGARRGEKE